MNRWRIISIHAPPAGSDVRSWCDNAGAGRISIHAPPAGSDGRADNPKRIFCISIHAPPAGSDDQGYGDPDQIVQFQSTLPLRGATCFMLAIVSSSLFQSTLPLRGATYQLRQLLVEPFQISIHAPPAGSDTQRVAQPFELLLFQSTLPLRGATVPAGA